MKITIFLYSPVTVFNRANHVIEYESATKAINGIVVPYKHLSDLLPFYGVLIMNVSIIIIPNKNLHGIYISYICIFSLHETQVVGGPLQCTQNKLSFILTR